MQAMPGSLFNQPKSLNQTNPLGSGGSSISMLNSQQTPSTGGILAQQNVQTQSLSNQNNSGVNHSIFGNTQNQQLNQAPLGIQSQSNVRDSSIIIYFTKFILKEFIRILQKT